MKEIKAQKQVRLGIRRCLQLSLAGMVDRLFRSGITVAILALAVAFLVHMLTYGLLSSATQADAFRELQTERRLGRTINRMLRPDSQAILIEALVGRDPSQMQEFEAWGNLTEAELERAGEAAETLQKARTHLNGLTPQNRAVLTGGISPLSLFRRLEETFYRKLFISKIEQLGVQPPLGSVEAFRTFLDNQWPFLLEVSDRIRAGHKEAIETVRAQIGDMSMRDALIANPDMMRTLLGEQGFNTAEVDFQQLIDFAKLGRDRETLRQMLNKSSVRAFLLRELTVPSTELALDGVYQWLQGSRRNARNLAAQLTEAGVRYDINADRLLSLASETLRAQRLQRIAGETAPSKSVGLFNLTGRNRWLILLAFIVCVVGVANAMLMSVTERFTQIATMKCLGAMDGSVMLIFVFESAIQGFVGGVIGIIAGIALAVARGFAEYGTLLTLEPSLFGDIAMAGVSSLLVGVVLATLAAVGPSLVAARLAPMEAMRVE